MAQLDHHKTVSFDELEDIIYLLKMSSDFDLSGYSKSSLKRRLERLMTLEKMDLVDIKNAILNIEGFASYFIQEISVNVTEMFRDPSFFEALREQVIPYLKTFPQVRLWSAGCATGEEVYSLAILLYKENILDRSFIYGTDINQRTLEIAKKGVYSIKKIKKYTENFNKVYTLSSLSDHYMVMYDAAIINNEYRSKALFSMHNLVSDNVFNEFQFISCRNVMIYFDKKLQERVLDLFYESLNLFGFLCLGAKESLYGHRIKDNFKVIDKNHNIFQKIK